MSDLKSLTICFLLWASPRLPAQNLAPPELVPQTATASTLQPGKTDVYSIRAAAGEILKLSCKSTGARADVMLKGPAGRTVSNPIGVAYRSLNRSFLWSAPVDGAYLLELTLPRFAESASAYELMLEAPHSASAVERAKLETDAKVRAARTARGRQQYDDALKAFRQALPTYREFDDRAGEMEVMRDIALVFDSKRDYTQELSAYEEALPLFREPNDPWAMGVVQNAIGYSYRMLGRNNEAEENYSASLASRKAAGDVVGQAQSLANLGNLRRITSRLGEAAAAYESALALYRRIGNLSSSVGSLVNLAVIYESLGKFQEELALADEGLAWAREIKDQRSELQLLYRKGLAYYNLNQFRMGIEALQRAIPLAGPADQALKGRILDRIGWWLYREGNVDAAIPYFEQSAPILKSTNQARELSQALTNLGLMMLEKGMLGEAQRRLDEALKVAGDANDSLAKAMTLEVSGFVARSSHGPDAALAIHRQAIEFAIEAKARPEEGFLRRDAGQDLIALDRPEEAIPELERSADLFRDGRRPAEQSRSLIPLGRAHQMMNRRDRAQECFDQALSLHRAMQDFRGEMEVLKLISHEYLALSEYDRAISNLSAAMSIARERRWAADQASLLNLMGMIYARLSERRAIECFTEALATVRTLPPGSLEAAILNNLALHYDRSGQPQKAIAYYEEALPKTEQLKDRVGLRTLHTNLSHAWLEAKNPQKAVEAAQNALALAIDQKDRTGQLRGLTALARALEGRGAHSEAMDRMQQALNLARDRRDPGPAAYVQKAIADLRMSRGEHRQAVTAYESALAGYRISDSRGAVAQTLYALSTAWAAAGQKSVAIIYGKQAVNALQTIRATTESLEVDLQEGFVLKHESYYRSLADLLISLGRLPEARQALDLLKNEEYSEFVGRGEAQSGNTGRQLLLTPEERAIVDRYAAIEGNIVTMGRRRSELIAMARRTSDEETELARLDGDIEIGNEAYLRKVDEIAASFAARPEAAFKVTMLRESQAFKDDLAELKHGAVVIYTLVTDSHYRAILTTPSVQKAYEHTITAAELSKKVFQFREAMQNPASNPVPIARELYNILIGPEMEEDLRQSQASVLMWSLDGVLRFLPLAALHDGKQYMAERFQQVVFTPASNARWKDPPRGDWRAAAFGVSKPHGAFPALPGVPSEVNGIVGPVLQGRALLDEAFTAPAMRETLRQRFPVVHVASHFKFEPGNKSASFLLLGDGTHLSLSEMERLENLFTGVDLLTLSACETGLGDVDSNGREVEGLGVLAQRQGAKAVIATLWPVADDSTSLLMQEFYRWRADHPDQTKSEALRHAQLSVLNGSVARPAAANDRGVTPNPRNPGNPESKRRHPYYWAPFFLIGNWL